MKLNKKLLLVSLLYFAEGFPFGIIEQTLPVYFRIHGMSLVHVGLLSLLSSPVRAEVHLGPCRGFSWDPETMDLGRSVSDGGFLSADPSAGPC